MKDLLEECVLGLEFLVHHHQHQWYEMEVVECSISTWDCHMYFTLCSNNHVHVLAGAVYIDVHVLAGAV